LDDPALIRVWSQRVLEHAEPKRREAIATMLELLGDRERALRWLRKAYETNPGDDDIVIVWASYYGDSELVVKVMRRSMDLWFFWLPLTAHARETEEFKNIVRDFGLVDYWREFGWNDYCSPVGEDDFECH
jgi:polyphosphate kinase 2 (PPK2 family)